MSSSRYPLQHTLEGNRLVLHHEVGLQERAAFANALRKLLATGGRDLLVDLTEASYVSSSCIGPIVEAADNAKEVGLSITVIASGRVAHVLRVAGVGELVDIRETGD